MTGGKRLKVKGLALMAMAMVSSHVWAKPPKPADLILTNGKIYTANASDAVMEAMAITDGRIVYVGNPTDAKAFAGKATRTIDLKGRFVMPGLIDGHMHPQSGGLRTLGCNLNYERLTRADFLARIEACLDAETTAKPDQWLTVINWFQQDMIPTSYAPTRHDLDTLKTQRPVMVRSSFGHSILVNSRALEVANITRATADPKDGKIVRDDKGEATGLLEEGAQGLVRDLIPPPDAATNLKAAQIALKIMNAQGITSFLDVYTDPETLTAYTTIYKANELTARAAFGVLIDPVEGYDADKAVNEVLRQKKQYEQVAFGAAPGLRIHTAKLFLDGVIAAPAFTGVMVEPYFVNTGTADKPVWRPGEHRGPAPYFTAAQLETTLLKLTEAGIDPHMHADGDGAVRQALDAIEAVRRGHPQANLRPAIAHAEIVDPTDFARFKALNALPVLSFQWQKPAADTVEAVRDYMGPYRHAIIEPAGLLEIYGATIVYGSDWPVDALNPWFALKVGLTRTASPADAAKYPGRLGIDPGLCLTTALKAMTINAAYSLRAETTTGSLEVGKFADMIVLDRDLFAIAPDNIADTKVLMTMVGGKVVYERK
ncbi:amidohydrolase [Asticcacaulis sp. SL142]|uniref:amidohydrolase n=1 Tax=Asticcacaulis sp. SL142 TaxID=2995155 RepID=UPI00226C9870|nr:amidohydrolase [Asticcacaulis sp. SL142]WAC47787.1 amidohydrolase [Asticcacaulis sp. SL142]